LSSTSISITDPMLQHLIPSNIFNINQDPLVMPHLSYIQSLGSSMSLSPIEISYQDIQSNYVKDDQNLHHYMEYHHFTFPIWVFNPINSHSFMDVEIHSN
jgi:hypothetical protein